MKKKYIKIEKIGKIITGKTPPTTNNEYWNSEIPFITPTDIKGFDIRYITETERSISQLAIDKNKAKLIKANSICITCIGSTIGKICMPKIDSVTNQQINSIELKKDYNCYYIYYLFRYLLPYIRLIGSGTGSGKDILNATKFKKIKIPIINNRDIRDRIGTTLSTYDDLIENNNSRIDILNQILESIYKHIFNYNKIKNNSKLIKLKEIISYNRGISYSSEEIACDEGNNLINLKNINAFGGFRRDGTKKYNGKYKDSQIVKHGDLIMGVTDMTQDRRTVGHVALVPELENISVISADLIKIESDLDNIFLYAMFKYGNISKYVSQFANGANVLHLTPEAMLNIKIQLPEKKLIDKFISIAKPIIAEIDTLNNKNDLLIKQRDLLLPRIITGNLKLN